MFCELLEELEHHHLQLGIGGEVLLRAHGRDNIRSQLNGILHYQLYPHTVSFLPTTPTDHAYQPHLPTTPTNHTYQPCLPTTPTDHAYQPHQPTTPTNHTYRTRLPTHLPAMSINHTHLPHLPTTTTATHKPCSDAQSRIPPHSLPVAALQPFPPHPPQDQLSSCWQYCHVNGTKRPPPCRRTS